MRSRRSILAVGAALTSMLWASAPTDAWAVRIKDIGYIDGVRPNQLMGYGLVVGLDGTGDTQRVGFTRQSLTAMLSRSGIRYDAKDLILRNVGAVMVTAKLHAFSQPGARLDVTVSSIGNARSLAGGTLLMTPLNGPDGKPYAVAQGPVQIGGFSIGGRSTTSRQRKKHLNTARIASGAIVEKGVGVALSKDDKLTLRLLRPDFTTVTNVVKALNGAAGALGARPTWAKAVDAGTVEMTVVGKKPEALPALIAGIEALDVAVGGRARVVINGRTGTIVLGGDARISEVAVAHHGMSLEIKKAQQMFQAPAPAPAPGAAAPGAAAPAQPVAPPATPVQKGQLQLIPGTATLADLVRGLNALGVQPRELVHILQAIAAAGALQAQLEVI